MTNSKKFFNSILHELKGLKTLEPTQKESIERIFKLIRNLDHAIKTSNRKKGITTMVEISKEVAQGLMNLKDKGKV